MGQRVVTADVSNPYRPTIIGRSQIVGSIASIVATDEAVLVKTREDAIWKFEALPDCDLALIDSYSSTDPDYPELPDYLDSDYTAEIGGYFFRYEPEYPLYGYNPLHVYKGDESTNQLLTAIGTLPEGEIAASNKMVVRGRYVYTTTGQKLAIYDLAVNPDLVLYSEELYLPMWKEIGTLPTDLETFAPCGYRYASEIHTVGDFLYVFGCTTISVWSLKDPIKPTLVKSLDRPDSRIGGSLVNPVFPVNNGFIPYKLIRNGTASILDTRDPANPIFRQVKLGDSEGWIWAASLNYLIYDDTELKLFDITDPFHPRLLDIPPQIDSPPVGMCGKYVFIDPSTTIDLSSPSYARQVDPSPSLVPDKPYWFTCDDQNGLYFTWTEENVNIYSLDNVDTPMAILDFPIPPSESYSIWHIGRRLYVTRAHELTSMDIENPIKPQASAMLPYFSDVVAYKDYLYFNMYGQGIGIFKLVPN